MNAEVSYLLHLADSSLILSQRQSEWCGHGPVLEQDIAITNITLDLLGQSRYLYQLAAERMRAQGVADASEDKLAFFRTEREFTSPLICELPNGDWAQTLLRLFFYSRHRMLLFTELEQSADAALADIARKSLKEIRYHHTWSAEWVIRMGDGTEESRNRILRALEILWPYVGELFTTEAYDPFPADNLQTEWLKGVTEIFSEAGLPVPDAGYSHTGGKKGIHTEHMGYILAEMQSLPRTHPGAEW